MDLKLDTGEDFPRRLVVFPCGKAVAYGDDCCNISCIDVDKGGKTSVRKFYEGSESASIRALAVSTDGQRIAVGYDNGDLRILPYDEYSDTTKQHPFIPPAKEPKNNENNDSDDEGNFFSQEEDMDSSVANNIPDNWWSGGLTFESSVRDLKFFPNSHWLAIASEDVAQGVTVVNVESEATTKDRRYLQLQCETREVHNRSGVRGVAVTSGNQTLVASLAMDGFLCVWNASPNGLQELASDQEKVLVTREETPCVTKPDYGEAMEADSWDRSCLPWWVSPTVLALPGQTHLQLRKVTVNHGNVVPQQSKEAIHSDTSNGHIETIVALTSLKDFIVSSGRDGRVILWQLQEDEDGLPTAQFVQMLGQYESAPTSLFWNDSNHTLYIACANGTLQMVTGMNQKKRVPSKRKTRSAQAPPVAEPENDPTSKQADVPESKETNKLGTGSKTRSAQGFLLAGSKVPKESNTQADEPNRQEASNAKETHVVESQMASRETSKQANKPNSHEASEARNNIERPVSESQTTKEADKPNSNEANQLSGKDAGKHGRKSPSGSSNHSPENEPIEGTDLLDTDDELNKSKPKSMVTKSTASSKLQAESARSDSEDEEERGGANDGDVASTNLPAPTMASADDKGIDFDMGKSQGDDPDIDPETQQTSFRGVSKSISAVEEFESDDEEDIPNATNRTTLSPELASSGKERTNSLTLLGASDDDVMRAQKGGEVPAKRIDVADSDDDAGFEQGEAMDLSDKIPQGPKLATSTSKRLVKKTNLSQEDDDDDDDIFEENSAKHDNRKPASRSAFIDDEAEDANENDEMSQPDGDNRSADEPDLIAAASDPILEDNGEQARQADDYDNDNTGGFGLNDDNYDDQDDSMAEDIAKINQNYQHSRQLATTSGPVMTEPQAAFAPSSTPLDLPRRFLCWNQLGSITLIQGDDTGRSTVDINFRDAAFRRPISFTDNMGFILGSLGDDGAIFATDVSNDDDDSDDDDVMEGLSLSAQTKAALKKSQKQRIRKGTPGRNPMGSNIYFHRFKTFAHQRDKDWYLTLPDGERVLGCACGSGWAAVATSRKFLRFFLPGGAQGTILWIPGNPVTMVGRNRFIAVFYHESMALPDGTQKLGYILYDAVAHRTISKGSVSCISQGASLTWCGFSNDYSLMALDSDGMLSMLVATSMPADDNGAEVAAPPISWEWAPVLDTVGFRKSAEDSFWAITSEDGKLVCIPLKGGMQYPDASGRRPVAAALKLKMPLARSAVAKSGGLEEAAVRSNIALVQKKVNNDIISEGVPEESFEEEYRTLVANVDKVTLKLFAKYVEAEKLERAYDLVRMLHLERSYVVAVKIAEAENRDNLADKIEEDMKIRFAAPVDEPDDFDEELSRTNGYSDNDDDLGSPPRHISPESNQLASKRALPNPAMRGRNVRPRAH